MNFKKLFERSDLYSIQNFLRYGGETFIKPDCKSYEQRLKDAGNKLYDFLKIKLPNCEEYEMFLRYIDEQTEVYFEIGILIGAKIGYETREKIEELK